MSIELHGQRVLLVYGLMGDLRASLRLDYMRGVEDWLRDVLRQTICGVV